MYDQYYIRMAEPYDVDNGLLLLADSNDGFEVKKNIQSITSSYFFPKSFVFVLVQKQSEKIFGHITLIIEKKLNGKKVAHVLNLSCDDLHASVRLIKHALDVAVQDGCVSVDAVCDDRDVDFFRINGFTMNEKYYASL